VQFVTKFEGDTIQMSDFTIMLENLPNDKFFNGDEDAMRMFLWNHCETLLQEQAAREGPTYSDDLVKTKF
jgi:hypothetical protein